jgi:hypothetical protein
MYARHGGGAHAERVDDHSALLVVSRDDVVGPPGDILYAREAEGVEEVAGKIVAADGDDVRDAQR